MSAILTVTNNTTFDGKLLFIVDTSNGSLDTVAGHSYNGVTYEVTTVTGNLVIVPLSASFQVVIDSTLVPSVVSGSVTYTSP